MLNSLKIWKFLKELDIIVFWTSVAICREVALLFIKSTKKINQIVMLLSDR